MKVPHVEVLAKHSGPESCGGYGNIAAEALDRGSVGGLLSSEITLIRVLTLLPDGEGHVACKPSERGNNMPFQRHRWPGPDFFAEKGKNGIISLKGR
jgi:hypothetical protein